jgi:hypothetical protein
MFLGAVFAFVAVTAGVKATLVISRVIISVGISLRNTRELLFHYRHI